MRLKDKKDDAQYNFTNQGWADEILDKFPNKIPILKDIPKGRGATSVNFRTLEDVAVLAEKLIYKRVGYESQSEVFRAAMYVGLTILWHEAERRSKHTPEADAILKRLQQIEKLTISNSLIKSFLPDVEVVYKSAELGVISMDERDEMVEEIITSFPPNLQNLARERLKRFLAGDKVSEIIEVATHGGDRRSKKFKGE